MGAADVTIAAYQRAFKTYFRPERIDRINYEEHPTLAMLTKVDDFEGFEMKYAVNYEDPTGVSNDFATAQANREPSQYAGFTPTRSRLYGVASITNETLRASRSKQGAYIEAKMEETEGLLRQCSRRLAAQLHRNGGGATGRRSGALSGNVLTLTNPEDAVFFTKGMRLVASDNDGSSAAHALRGGTAAIVDSVDRDAGTVTSTTWGNITTFTASDYLFPEGDFKVAFKGFDGWIPATAPVVGGGDSWLGQDRSEDPVRLAGVRFNASSTPSASGLSIVQKCIRGVARLKREGGAAPDVIVMNDDRCAELAIELEGSKQRHDTGRIESAHAGIGFDVIKLFGGGKAVSILADHNTPDHVAWMLRKDTWKLCSLGKLPGFLTDQQLIIEAARDGFEIRVGGYGQNICKAPGYNGRIDLDA